MRVDEHITMSDDLPDRLWRTASEHYLPVAGIAGGAGVVMIWQNLGPSWLGTVLLLGGIGWWAYHDHIEKSDEVDKMIGRTEAAADPEKAKEAVESVGADELMDADNWNLGEDEAPWWDTEAHPTTKDRIEAMKRQDPDYEEDDNGDDESILDKFARVLGMDEDSKPESESESDGESEPLFEPIEADLGPDLEVEADVGGLEEGLDFGGDLEAELEDDAR